MILYDLHILFFLGGFATQTPQISWPPEQARIHFNIARNVTTDALMQGSITMLLGSVTMLKDEETDGWTEGRIDGQMVGWSDGRP